MTQKAKLKFHGSNSASWQGSMPNQYNETMKTNSDTAHFLKALLWAYPEDNNGENPMAGKSIHDFSKPFIDAATEFLERFRAYLESRHPDLDPDDFDRDFGGNVYLSLSGHGCGFWDTEEGEPLQAALEAFSGIGYRFEDVDLVEDGNGKLDLCVASAHLDEHRENLFGGTND